MRMSLAVTQTQLGCLQGCISLANRVSQMMLTPPTVSQTHWTDLTATVCCTVLPARFSTLQLLTAAYLGLGKDRALILFFILGTI